jgi:hypothetical protein
MKKFMFSGTTKANYALLAETGSAFLFLWSEKNRAAETLRFSAAITYQLWQVGVKETDRLSVQFEGMCCALSFSEFCRTECGIFPEKHLRVLRTDFGRDIPVQSGNYSDRLANTSA